MIFNDKYQCRVDLLWRNPVDLFHFVSLLKAAINGSDSEEPGSPAAAGSESPGAGSIAKSWKWLLWGTAANTNKQFLQNQLRNAEWFSSLCVVCDHQCVCVRGCVCVCFPILAS